MIGIDRKKVIDDLRAGCALECDPNIVSRANPWWIVNTLDKGKQKRLYQVPYDIANDLVHSKVVVYRDAVPPVRSWANGKRIISYSGYVYNERSTPSEKGDTE